MLELEIGAFVDSTIEFETLEPLDGEREGEREGEGDIEMTNSHDFDPLEDLYPVAQGKQARVHVGAYSPAEHPV